MFNLTYLKERSREVADALKCMFAPRPAQVIASVEHLQQFLDQRASHVTQTALYGYLRTRAGSRYPELFANEIFAKAMNAAKWNIWVACVSDLAIYAGGLICRRGANPEADTARVIAEAIEAVLLRVGVPAEADSEYPAVVARLRERVHACAWRNVPDNEAAFTESPGALVHWAPIVDELKQLDEEIVMNSVRFRWKEVRQELRQGLDADALLAGAAPVAAPEDVPATRG